MSAGIVVAGTHSGSGKTTIALALMAAFSRQGLRVAPFKVGPDFIDPGHHRIITGRPSTNLDGWMLTRGTNRDLFAKHRSGCDVAVVEGVMGLYDGYDGKSEAGSTAQMAKWLNLPVVLVVDARSMARSAAALVMGFERFDPQLRFAGVVFNRVGSPGHLDFLRDALAGAVAMPCLGGLMHDDRLAVPERHLGLTTAEDHPWTPAVVDRMVDWLQAGIDCRRLIGPLSIGARRAAHCAAAPHPVSGGPRIGIARDRAFCFYYPDNLSLLSGLGAELVDFSPITDRRLPENLDGLYLGGGYPELSAGALAGNRGMREAVRLASRSRMPIYAECGGFMFLCRELIDLDGAAHAMAGCFPFVVRMDRHLRSLGYREVTLTEPTILGEAGARIRGHEFHYSALEGDPASAGVPTVFSVAARTGSPQQRTGYCTARTVGSYLHLHFGSNPAAAGGFVDACRRYHRERTHGSS